jgi:hypothetical protein
LYGYDPETKQQSSQWMSPQSPGAKKAVVGQDFNKGHAQCFLDLNGIVHYEYVPPNTTVNSDFYCAIFRLYKENVRVNSDFYCAILRLYRENVR